MRMRILPLAAFVFFTLPCLLAAQDAELRNLSDSEFLQRLAARRAGNTGTDRVQSSAPAERCGFGWTIETARRARTMSAGDRETMMRLIAHPNSQVSLLSPSRRFRVHYDTSGRHMAALLDQNELPIPGTSRAYAEAVAGYFDLSYQVEVLQRGYCSPPHEAGSTEYNIYIVNVGLDYGQTMWNAQIPSNTVQPIYTTFIEIDNDFAGAYFSKGLEGAQVTAAHEFHHMIQLGCYGMWSDDRYFHEMTSTYYEDEVFPLVNDYYQYLDTFFVNPDRSMHAWGLYGYPLVLFPKMLEKKTDTTLFYRVWEGMRRVHPYTALDEALRSSPEPSDVGLEMCAFGRWNYYTAYRSQDGPEDERYSDAAAYPKVKISTSLTFVDGAATISGAVPPFATQYSRVNFGVDTAAFSVTNIDLASAVRRATSAVSYTLELRREGFGPEYNPVGNGWGYRFIPSGSGVLCLNVYSRGAIPDLKAAVSPNPYDPVTDGVARIAVPNSMPQARGTLAIFSASMDRIFLKENAEIRSDPSIGRYFAWDGKDGNGFTVPSGIYFYAIEAGGGTITGKIAIVRR